MFVLLTKDLMIQSSTSAAAKSCDAKLVTVSSADKAIQIIDDPSVGTLFVDLQTPGLNMAQFIEKIKTHSSQVQVIVFAQHVEEQLLELFRNESRFRVLTRGQFSFQLPSLMAQDFQTDSATKNP